ncbi:MAG: glycerophosphodiester phosphodiesterase family protein [Hyphomonas sp.]
MARPFNLNAFAYAHRGLWQTSGPPENSLAAFRAAARAGLGIELDLRPSADGETMIFHDDRLDRMTPASGLFEARGAAELRTLRLTGSEETVPGFSDLLDIWPQSLPMLCEMKVDAATDPVRFARSVAARLKDWKGLAAAMSFSEAGVRALPENMMRGQLIAPASKLGEAQFTAIAGRAVRDGIDYLGVHHTDVARAEAIARTSLTPFVVWTVRSQAELEAVRPYGCAIIFEHIDPAPAAP